MLDLDNFKKINDTPGHLKGDQALKVFSNALTTMIGRKEVIGRYGGDEFIVILKNMEDAQIVTLLTSVQTKLFELSRKVDKTFPITYSYGCYRRLVDEQISYDEIVCIVDQNMYQNKHTKVQ